MNENEKIQSLLKEIHQTIKEISKINTESAKKVEMDKTMLNETIKKVEAFLDLEVIIQDQSIEQQIQRINKLLRIDKLEKPSIYPKLKHFGEKESLKWNNEEIETLVSTIIKNQKKNSIDSSISGETSTIE